MPLISLQIYVNMYNKKSKQQNINYIRPYTDVGDSEILLLIIFQRIFTDHDRKHNLLAYLECINDNYCFVLKLITKQLLNQFD